MLVRSLTAGAPAHFRKRLVGTIKSFPMIAQRTRPTKDVWHSLLECEQAAESHLPKRSEGVHVLLGVLYCARLDG